MPRKVKKQQTNSSRPQPTVPDGDEGKHLTEKERVAKVEAMIEDFIEDGLAQIEAMRVSSIALYTARLDAQLVSDLGRIPAEIRKMPVSEYLAKHCTLNQGPPSEPTAAPAPSIAEMIKEQLTRTYNLPQVTVPDNPPPTCGQSSRPTRAAKLNASAAMSTQMNESVSQGTRTHKRCPDMPLVTPRLDPRLMSSSLVTPAIGRPAQPNEPRTTVNVSENGSPLIDENSYCLTIGKKVVKLDRGQFTVPVVRGIVQGLDEEDKRHFSALCQMVNEIQAELK